MWFFLWACLIAKGADSSVAASSKREVLTSAAQVLALTPEQLAASPSVRLRGVVTLYQSDWGLFFIQDLTGGVYIADDQRRSELAIGQYIEVEGIADRGRRSNIIRGPQIRFLAASESPGISPRPVSLEFLTAARADAQWVALTNTVRQVTSVGQNLKLRLGPEQSGVSVFVPFKSMPTDLSRYFRAHIAVRGVCTEQADEHGNLYGISVFSASENDLEVLAFASQPLDAPLQSINDCLNPAHWAGKDPWVRVKGTVASSMNDHCFNLDDGIRGIEIRSDIATKVEAGEVLDITGFVVPSDRSARLEDAVVRRLGSGSPPRPIALTAEQLRQTDIEGRLVTLDARFLEYSRHKDREVLSVAAMGTTLLAELRATNEFGRLAALKPDSQVRLTGIWLGPLEKGSDPRARLLLRSSAQAELLRLPSWWTPKRLLMVVGGLGCVSLLVLGWAILLKAQVRRNTDQIRQRLEKEAELEKRFRDLVENANDLICTLDKAGRFISVNRAGERILGFSRVELGVRRLEELVTLDAPANLSRILAANEGSTAESVLELKVTAKDGTQRILEADSRPFGTDGIQVIARDVTERKKAEAELAALQSRLLDASRKAGMTEVATAILHNVGNVLNSVNVSASLVSDQFNQSKSMHIARVARVMEEHSADLANFITNDPKGRLIPQFLSELSRLLAEERTNINKELSSLRENVEHIKMIVTAQQSYTRSGGVIEVINPAQLVDDALRINAIMLEHRKVKISCLYDRNTLPVLNTDKHKVLQILINLIRNAAFACEELGRAERCLVIGVLHEDGRIKFSVRDNGVGIAPDNLKRIFNHGFTTRKDGHGFGLHSGILAAKEMGGDLRAESEGPGKGAVFTLALPVS